VLQISALKSAQSARERLVFLALPGPALPGLARLGADLLQIGVEERIEFADFVGHGAGQVICLGEILREVEQFEPVLPPGLHQLEVAHADRRQRFAIDGLMENKKRIWTRNGTGAGIVQDRTKRTAVDVPGKRFGVSSKISQCRENVCAGNRDGADGARFVTTLSGVLSDIRRLVL